MHRGTAMWKLNKEDSRLQAKEEAPGETNSVDIFILNF